MPARLVNIDPDTLFLLPPDLRDWVAGDHLVHFSLDAVGLLDLRAARINHRGSGSEQDPPSLMLGLLIYAYATGTFSSRRSERNTHEQVAVRLLCADHHPDHDSTCTFRRENRALLLQKADAADRTPLDDGLTVPAKVARRQDRLEKLRAATAEPSEARQPKGGAFARRAAPEGAGNTGSGFAQSCNAQAAVEIESRLLVSETVTDAPNDKEQLEPTLAATRPVIENIAAVLIDSGFYSAAAVTSVERGREGQPGPVVYASTGRQPHGRSVEALEKRDDPPAPGPGAGAAAVMAHRLSTKAGRALYALRKQTIEPVSGIIKAALEFRQFSLRGLDKVRTEWTLVTLAYNLKRLYHLGTRL